jgi:prephenate dehydrogenase
MKIAIIGLGLIGGSLALEFKKNKENTIYGIDSNAKHQQEAIDLKLVDKIVDFDFVKEVDVVVIAVPVDVIPSLVVKVLDLVNENTLVFDVGSTKEVVCNAVKNHSKRKNFVAIHPIAGTEFSGPNAAIENLFTKKVNIICEQKLSDKKQLEKLINLFKPIQMRMVFMDSAKQHDKHIAYVSHLSHISSFMLGKTVLETEKDEKNIFDMAGSGFESTVRLAKSSPKTWTPIFIQNKKHILKSLDEYIINLQAFKSHLKKSSSEEIYNVMNETNHIKEVLNGIIK